MQELYLEYVNAKPTTQEQAIALAGRNSVVGAKYRVEHHPDNKYSSINNEFGDEVSRLDYDDTQKLRNAENLGLVTGASLAWVAIEADTQKFFAKFLLFGYNKNNTANKTYVDRFIKRLASGVRPDCETSKYVLNQIKSTDGK